jgi:hypothetical protein
VSITILHLDLSPHLLPYAQCLFVNLFFPFFSSFSSCMISFIVQRALHCFIAPASPLPFLPLSIPRCQLIRLSSPSVTSCRINTTISYIHKTSNTSPILCDLLLHRYQSIRLSQFIRPRIIHTIHTASSSVSATCIGPLVYHLPPPKLLIL